VVRVPADTGNFSLYHCVQTGSGAHRASYAMGTGGSFPGGKQPVREADRSPPSSAEVKEYVQLYVFVAWCFVKHRSNFTFTVISMQKIETLY